MSKYVAAVAERHGMSRRSLTIIFAFGMIALALVLLPGRAGGALPTPALFELDGNALTDHLTAGIPDDWDRIYCAQQSCSPDPGPNSANAINFITAPQTVFGGGSKDTKDISTWACVGGSPSKNDMANVFAAAYTDPASHHTIVYFGADRDSTNGNSNLGFWFIQDPTFGNNCSTTNSGTFTGTHQVGDVFVTSSYTNGGSQPTVDVYTWNGSGLTQVATADPACTNNGAGQAACAIGNAGAVVNAPWQATSFPMNGFFEGGIDLNTLFSGSSAPCFTNFLGETRSSASDNAELKNFGSGGLDTCASIELKKAWVGQTGSTSLSIGTSAAGHEVVGPVPAPPASTTGVLQVSAGTYHVSESLANDTAAGSYGSSLKCVNTKNGGSADVTTTPDSGVTGRSDQLSLSQGDVVVCTYTNTYNLFTPTVGTAIHNSAHQAVTAVELGKTVHDSVSVSGAGGTPTGSVTFDWFANGSCTGAPASTSSAVAISGSGTTAIADATGFPQTPSSAGAYSFEAHYPGSATYAAADGPCESLSVVDANVAISPLAATNKIDDPHTFTATVKVNDGSGSYVNAPDGTTVTFSKVSGPGTFTPVNGQCTTTAGSCSVQLVSGTPGVTTIKATTTLTVGGVSLTRTTGDTNAGDSANAQKTWVDANINITPLTATNAVNDPHTFTATVKINSGTGGYVNAPDGTTVTFSKDSGPGTFTPANGQCTTSAGSCSVQLVSATPGVTTIQATTDVTVGGVTVTRTTNDANAGDGPNAQKTWVDANITISPLTATNEIGNPHTFTATVKVDTGAGFVNAPDNTPVTFSIASGPGSLTPADGQCTTTGGSCSVQVVSSTPGVTTLHATTSVTVAGKTLTRSTGDADVNDGPDAQKTWVDANIQISPHTATNAVGDPHVYTATVQVNDGTGFGPAPDGTPVTFSKVSGPGTFTPADGQCTTTGGSCTVSLLSSVPGVTTVSAATEITVGGIKLDRATGDQNAGDGPDAQKTWVDANINITPLTATNAVNDPHTFTATVKINSGTGGYVNAPDGTPVTFSITGGPGSLTPADGKCTTSGGSCSIQLVSATPGVTTIQATTELTLGGVKLDRTTGDQNTGDGPNAQKTWVDANITISPLTATNEIGNPHVFTATVKINNGTGDYANAPDGTTISFSKTGPGSFTPTSQCTTSGGTGSCTVTLTSTTTGTTTVSAATTLSVGGATLSRATGDQNAGDGPNAAKTWVDARIAIDSNAVNEVGSPHTFTLTVSQDTGTGSFTPVQGATVTPTLTDSNGATHAATAGTCVTGTTSSSGQCTIVVSSSTTGKVTVHATTTVTVGGQSITRATGDGKSGDSADAVKTFVDSYITITPATATNPLGVTHTFTAAVFVNDGSGAGYVAAPNGTPVTFSFQGSHVGSFTSATTCTTVGGSCSATDVSTTAGDDTVRAATSVTVGGVTMSRATGTSAPGHVNSSDALKHWVSNPPPPSSPQNPAISITKNPKSQTISSGATANFVIVVTNTGNVTLTNVNVTDPLSPDCSKTSAQISALASMAPGAGITYNCSLQNVSASFTNVATATGTPPSGANVTASDSAPVTVTPPFTPPPAKPKPTPTDPSIDIVKGPKSQSLGVGGTAHFKITVTNTGEVTLTDVTVTDPLSPDCNRHLGTLAVGASRHYTCTKANVTEAFQNVATVTGKPPTGAAVKATDHANIKVAAFTPPQHPSIAIAKNPNNQTVTTKLTTITGANGSNKTTVVYGDARFTIKVTNTGDVALHNVKVADPLTTDCNKNLGTIAAGGSKTYSCTRSAVTANFTNVATATGVSPKGLHVHASDSADVKVTTKTASTSGAEFTG
jgi:uncharacterized repeat protein (TIGR01451 family)